jgi:signal transduction histidine kinase
MAGPTTSFLRLPPDVPPQIGLIWTSSCRLSFGLVAVSGLLALLPTTPVITTAGEAIAALSSLVVAGVYLWSWWISRDRRRRLALSLLGLGFVSIAVGSLARWSGIGSGQMVLLPGLLFPPLFLAGVLVLPHAELKARDLWRLALDAVIVLLGAVSVLLLLATEVTTLGNDGLVALILPLGDLVALAALLWLVTGRRESGIRGFAGWLAWAAVFLVITDVGSGWQVLAQGPVDIRLIGLGWTLFHVCAALGAVRLILSQHLPVDGLQGRRVADSLAISYGVLAATVLVHLGVPLRPTPLGLGCISLLLILVLIRQALALRDHADVQRRLEAISAEMEERILARTRDLERQVSERQRAEVAEREQRLLAEALRDTAEVLASTLELGELLDRVLANVGRAAPHTAATVLFIEDDVARVVHHSGYRERGLGEWVSGIEIPITSWPRLHAMMTSGQADLIADTRGESGWWQAPQVAWVGSWLGAPLTAKGRVFGFLSLVADAPGVFTAVHRDRLMAFAHQMGLALENARLFAQIRRRVERLSLVAEVSTRLNRLEDLEATLDDVVARIPPALGASRVVLALADPDGQHLHVVADHGEAAHPTLCGRRYPRAPWAEAGLLARNDLTLLRDPARDVRLADPRLDDLRMELAQGEVASLLLVPLQLQGVLLGVLQVQSRDSRRSFTASEGELLRTLSNLLAARVEVGRMLLVERAARAAAEEASRLKSEFLANTSHELRTPLTGILLSLELAGDGSLDDPGMRQELLETAQFSGQRLLTTINGLLDLAKIEAGRLDVHPERLDPIAAVEAVFAALRARAVAGQVELALAGWTGGAAMHVWADSTLLHQILTNLVGNALKFTEKGGVVVSLRAVGERVVIRIADTGIGIAPAQLERLFQPFVQADGSSTRRFEGTGLGLVIARRMAEQMGGSLILASDGPGRGTVAEVELPSA